MKNTFLLINNVISIFDLFKILITYFIDDMKILEIKNKNINRQYLFKVLQSSYSEDLKRRHLFPLRVKLLFFILLKINSVILQIYYYNNNNRSL